LLFIFYSAATASLPALHFALVLARSARGVAVGGSGCRCRMGRVG